jgi:hypothetical protein
MKKLMFAAFIGLLFSSCGNDNTKVQMGKKTTMTVNAVYDAGRVAKGEMIHAKFKVENTGDYALVLSDVKGSCSCTVADWSKDPIAPGESGFIKAKVNTENFSKGPMKRSIRILSNTTPEQTVVTVQAIIIQ